MTANRALNILCYLSHKPTSQFVINNTRKSKLHRGQEVTAICQPRSKIERRVPEETAGWLRPHGFVLVVTFVDVSFGAITRCKTNHRPEYDRREFAVASEALTASIFREEYARNFAALQQSSQALVVTRSFEILNLWLGLKLQTECKYYTGRLSLCLFNNFYPVDGSNKIARNVVRLTEITFYSRK